jgi:hypothetical protein
MNARLAIQFGVTDICRVYYRVFTASPPMRPSRLGPLMDDDFGFLLT